MTIWLWIGFLAFVFAMLAIDLGVLHRKAHVIAVPEALAWTAVTVVLAVLFTGLVHLIYKNNWLGMGLGPDGAATLDGTQAAFQFFTGYVIEQSLSLDNMFVFAVIFQYFAVPALYQHRVLFWGILGALVMRAAMILAGVALVQQFSWINYVFGGLLILTAFKMLAANEEHVEPERNPLVRLARRLFPVSPSYEGTKFFTRIDGKRAITPLFIVLLVVESTDVLFAVDSIPAIFAVTRDPFLIFTSNVFAILALRSMYFAIAGMMRKFKYLKISLVVVLLFVGVKMLLSHHHPIPIEFSLAFIATALSFGVFGSVLAADPQVGPVVAPLADSVELVAVVAWKQARRLVLVVIGATILVLGLIMLITPGPGMLFIPAGLAILGTEFVWARRLLRRARQGASSLVDTIRGAGRDSST